MSTLRVSITIKKNGVLADADSTPTLADAAGAFGIRRVSDGVVVVASGTAMTRQSLGVYTYDFASAVAGVVYEWSARAVIDSVPYYKQETASVAELTSTSYLTVTDADALAATLPLVTAWSAAGSVAKAPALELASQRFDLAYRFQGRRFDGTQALEFPRVAYDGGREPGATYEGQQQSLVAATIWDWDADAGEAIVPQLVKRAVLYEANSILAADRDRVLAAIHNGIASQSVGSISESYRQLPAAADGGPVLCREADLVARRYKLRSGRIL